MNAKSAKGTEKEKPSLSHDKEGFAFIILPLKGGGGLLVVLRTKLTNDFCCTPHLRVVQCSEFLLKTNAVVGL